VVKLDGDRLSPLGTAKCTVDFSVGADGRVSPDGRHLVLGRWSSGSQAGPVTLIDLQALGTEASHCGPSRAEPVWTQNGFVLVDNGKVITCPDTLSLNLQPGVPAGEAFTVIPVAS
jgi:hypothetical protein